MRKLALVLLLLASPIVSDSLLLAARCTPWGQGRCTACKNCKYCQHCGKGGGTCSVCRRK